jgi:anti-sigma factor RsiW
MTRWRCRLHRARLVDYAGGALEAAPQRRLERHLARCRRCTRDLEALRSLPPLLHASAVPDPGEEFWRQQRQAVGRAIRAARAPGTTAVPSQYTVRWNIWRYPLAVAAAALLALFVYQFAGGPGESAPDTAPSQVAALDTGSLLALDELMQAVAPVDEDLLAPQVAELSSDELEDIDELIGDVG